MGSYGEMARRCSDGGFGARVGHGWQLVLTLTLAGVGVCAGVMALQSGETSRSSDGEEVTKRCCDVRSLSFVLFIYIDDISNR